MSKKKLQNHNQQKIIGKKREIFERNNELLRLEKLKEKEEREQKAREILNKNKNKISERKKEIIQKIKQKEYNTQQFWKRQQKKK